MAEEAVDGEAESGELGMRLRHSGYETYGVWL
jgi:hypothetical protein